MTTKRKSSKRSTKSANGKIRQAVLGKPAGVIQPRVQEVGPEHFGVVAVDCAKDRSKWMMCDFFGKLLVEPTVVEHRFTDLKIMSQLVQQACERHQIKDMIACVEMTGSYHRTIYHHLKKEEYDTRIVHPFASSHYRTPLHGDIKTDDNDLVAIFRAGVNGFGLLEKPWDEVYLQLQILVRHRRDLVKKRSKLQCQIRQHLELALPGFTSAFATADMWQHPLALGALDFIAEHGGCANAVVQAGLEKFDRWLRDRKVRFQKRTLDRIYCWARDAAQGDQMAPSILRVWLELLEDWKLKTKQIAALEVSEASLLVKTPYILLLSHPGISVVSAAELAGETGPIEHYASSKSITGRGGIFPGRYQSDEVDRSGNLSRFRNGKMRAAWLMVASNMVKCNAYWRAKANHWREQGASGPDVRCRIANRLTRPVFQMVSGGKLYSHPSRLDRGYVLEKIMQFHRDHETAPARIVADLQLAAEQIPSAHHAEEAAPLYTFYQKSIRSRRREPKTLGDLLVGVLARLGVRDLESP